MAYEDVIKKFEKIQHDINTSNHDRMSYEDYEASDEEISECVRDFGLGTPEWMDEKEVYLPLEFFEEAFGPEPETGEELDRILNTPEYKKLEEMYRHLYDQVVVIATEMSAYYENEAREVERYYDSMRGPL